MSEDSESFKLSSGSETPTNSTTEVGGKGGGGSSSSAGGTPTAVVTGSSGVGSVGVPEMGGAGPAAVWTSAPHVDDYYYYNPSINFQQNGYYFPQNFGPPPNMGMAQNGPFGHRRSPFGPQQGQRHAGNNAGASVGRFPPFGFQQQRQPMRPGMKGGAMYGKPSPTMMMQPNFRRNFPGKGAFQPQFDGNAVAGENETMYQERNGAGGPLDNMRSLEQYLSDMMRTGGGEPDGRTGGKWNYSSEEQGGGPSGANSGFILDGEAGPTVGVQSVSPRAAAGLVGVGASGVNEQGERFSRKVFVGGLPPDIDEEEITASFRRFGPLVVDWPHKAESKSYFPPKGYAFLLFQVKEYEESSVQQLIDACIQDDDKLYLCVSSPTIKDKPVQIRPWRLSDADFVLDASMPLDPRKTVFVGGVPRPLKAVELAMIMDRLYGGVCYAGIDTDPELKYPKGAGRVAFSNQQSYIAAISARFVQLQHGDIDKRVEVKPYVLDDQLCDECGGGRCGGKFAPFFCANVTCLQYYCEHCWATIHSRPGREYHKPLVKEGADRPRALPFRPNYYRRLVTVNSQM
ncbi:cytoplasmic polyadenylation element-binding protein 2 isoform X2 [Folsomia candida]|uniref:cytoplasmic polyadenylation element-binding protein 2 isoform X2 n=1 Tax=Folsomia candida TaxID=158441 RepID=UPI000B904D66|nr:cytoplasmic polyadenylation element-binding protein 2 isoform X2 [Folsomia candida]